MGKGWRETDARSCLLPPVGRANGDMSPPLPTASFRFPVVALMGLDQSVSSRLLECPEIFREDHT